MILRRQRLRTFPGVFKAMTGLTVAAFDTLVEELTPAFHAAGHRRLDRPGRQRAGGGGDHFDLDPADQLLLTVVWLRHYPTQEVLGYLFGVSDSTALRAVRRWLPLLEQSGRDTLRMPDPGRGRRKKLPQLLAETPGLAVVIGTFERRIRRPRRPQRAYYSGKKKGHTLKSQVVVDEDGRVADVADSRPGRWGDLKVLRRSGLRRRLPKRVGASGDLAYVGIADWHPRRLGATPRREPRGRPRPEADRRFNRAFARRRIVVEHTIGRMRRDQCLSQVDRHRRRGHTARVRAVAGLVNRMLDHRVAA